MRSENNSTTFGTLWCCYCDSQNVLVNFYLLWDKCPVVSYLTFSLKKCFFDSVTLEVSQTRHVNKKRVGPRPSRLYDYGDRSGRSIYLEV